ncbi:hypothetical protein CAL22_10385 [Bordetella genomosp. 12]|uniref:OmpA-like domain-containing protein n=2 Tax=Bordetella genomosp. 12 TaxID=463035 RepID=A0A261VL20_9BORD|nr:hypothetical protein CAL22_10385 [Bordetella genomosp. 12]
MAGGAGLLAVMLAGCGTPSTVNPDGTAAQLVWPDPASAVFRQGSYPNVQDLRLIGPGMTRDEIYNLIGRPHFREGFRVREWNYLFHFRTPAGEQVCQYKVVFDTDRIVRSMYWQPEACAGVLDMQAPAVQRLSLSSDVLFAFDSANLTASGRERLQGLAQRFNAQPESRITVIGHTDRLGPAAYNQDLSERRAAQVRDALVSAGVAAEHIRSRGAGSSEPQAECAAQPREGLIACLAPDRRVDIEVKPGR